MPVWLGDTSIVIIAATMRHGAYTTRAEKSRTLCPSGLCPFKREANELVLFPASFTRGLTDTALRDRSPPSDSETTTALGEFGVRSL